MRWIVLQVLSVAPLCVYADEKAEYRKAVQALTDVYLAGGMQALRARTAAVAPGERLTLLNGVLTRVYWTERDIAEVLTIGEGALEIGADAIANAADDAAKRRSGNGSDRFTTTLRPTAGQAGVASRRGLS